MPFRPEIVRPITGRWILADLVLVGHGQSGPREAARRSRREWRRMRTEPLEMGLTCVGAAALRIPIMILFNKSVGEITEPLVVRGRFPHPARTGMILVGGLIAMDTGLRGGRGIYVRGRAAVESVLRGPEELRGLKNHLDNVLIAVRLCGKDRQGAQKEDVHPVDGAAARALTRIKFSPPSGGKICIATESRGHYRRPYSSQRRRH